MDGAVSGSLVGVRKGAALLGLNPSTVSRQLSKFEAEGRVSTSVVGGEKLFDLDAFRAAAGASLNPLKARQGGAAVGLGIAEPAATAASAPKPGLATAATAHKALQARLLEHDLNVKLGRVVDKSAVASVMQGAARELRDALLALPARLKGELASMTDPAEIQRLLDRHVREMVEALGARFARLATDEPEAHEEAAE